MHSSFFDNQHFALKRGARVLLFFDAQVGRLRWRAGPSHATAATARWQATLRLLS